jgi:hypothetical protein
MTASPPNAHDAIEALAHQLLEQHRMTADVTITDEAQAVAYFRGRAIHELVRRGELPPNFGRDDILSPPGNAPKMLFVGENKHADTT